MTKTRVVKGLAGAAAMAGATQAYGAVINVTPPANIVGHAPTSTNTPTYARIDLDGNGTRDIEFAYSNLSETNGSLLLGYVYAGGTATGNSPGMVVGAPISGQAYAYSLTGGYKVGPAAAFYQKAGYLGHLVTNYNGTNYGFTAHLGQAGVIEFVGFEFKTSTTATTYDYGYAELETDPYVSAANPGGLKFLALAYDNTGAAITIPSAIPEPGSLAALALGAATCVGLGIKRRKLAAK